MWKDALLDLRDAAKRADLWIFMGWHEVRQRYRRSVLGPLWITLATMIFVALITTVYGALFQMNVDEFLPLVAIGLVVWTLISSSLIEGATVFINASATIRQIPAPLPVHVFKLVWQQLIYFAHNAIVIVLVLLITTIPVNFAAVLSIPALLIVVANVSWMAFFLGVVGARYRDVPSLVSSSISALFIATPVIWPVSALPSGRAWVAYGNPFTYLIEIIRLPLLGTPPPASMWLVCVAMAVAGWIAALAVYARSRRLVAYWV